MAASKEGIARARQILENDRREINKVEEHYAGGGCKNCPAKKNVRWHLSRFCLLGHAVQAWGGF